MSLTGIGGLVATLRLAGHDASTLLALQKAAGNRAVTSLMGSEVGAARSDARGNWNRLFDPRGVASVTVMRQSPPSEPQPEPSETKQVDAYRFEYRGQERLVPKDEWPAFTKLMLGKLRSGPYQTLLNQLDLIQNNYASIKILNEEHRVISYFSELFGGANLDDSFVDSAFEQLQNADAWLNGTDIAAGQVALTQAGQAVAEAGESLDQYEEALFGGAKTTINVLQITETAAFAVASVAGGAVLVSVAEMSVVGAAAVSGGGTALVQGIVTEAPKVASGQEKIGDAAIKVLIDAGLNAAGAALGARAAPFVGEKLGKLALAYLEPTFANFGPETVGAMRVVVGDAVNDFVAGGLGNAVQGMVGDLRGVVTAETTWEEFADHVVTNVIAGGFMGVIAARMRALRTRMTPAERRSLDRELVPQLDEIAKRPPTKEVPAPTAAEQELNLPRTPGPSARGPLAPPPPPPPTIQP